VELHAGNVAAAAGPVKIGEGQQSHEITPASGHRCKKPYAFKKQVVIYIEA